MTRLVTRPFLVVTAATFAFFLYVGVLVPLVPRYVEDELGGGELGIGLAIAVFAGVAIAVRPLIGQLVVRYGRRAVMIGGAAPRRRCRLGVRLRRLAAGPPRAARRHRGRRGGAVRRRDDAHRRPQPGGSPRRGGVVLLRRRVRRHRHRSDHRRGDARHVGLPQRVRPRRAVRRRRRPRVDRRARPTCPSATRASSTATPAPRSRTAAWLHPAAVGPGIVLASGMAAFAVFSAFLPDYSTVARPVRVRRAVRRVQRHMPRGAPRRRPAPRTARPAPRRDDRLHDARTRLGAARRRDRAVGVVGRRSVRRCRHGVHVPVADGVHGQPHARRRATAGDQLVHDVLRGRYRRRRARPRCARRRVRQARPGSPPPSRLCVVGCWLLRSVVIPTRVRSSASRCRPSPPRCRQLAICTTPRRGHSCCPISASQRAAQPPSWNHGVGPRTVLPSGAEPRCALRRLVRRRRAHDRHLLPSELPRRHAASDATSSSSRPPRRPTSTATGRASDAAPTPRLARRSGTSAATSSPGRCACSATVSSIARASSGLARRLHYSDRHLNRVITDELGAGPLAIARAQRATTARVLIETSECRSRRSPSPPGSAASASSTTRCKPCSQRRRRSCAPPHRRSGPERRRRRASSPSTSPCVRRSTSPPRCRSSPPAPSPGSSTPTESGYRRALALPNGHGVADVSGEAVQRAGRTYVGVAFRLADWRDLAPAVRRIRRLLDLDADPVAVDAALGNDAVLADLVAAAPGLRVPGSVDPFETAVRAVVGQQVSVAGARTIVGRIVGPRSAHRWPCPTTTSRTCSRRRPHSPPSTRRGCRCRTAGGRR